MQNNYTRRKFIRDAAICGSAFSVMSSSFKLFASEKKSVIQAVDPCEKTPYNINKDLRDPLFSSANIITTDNSPTYYGKTGTNYKDAEYYDSTNLYLSDCGVNIPCESDPNHALYYFVSYPSTSAHDYNTCKLPVIFIFHPGGFSDCNYSGPHIKLLSKELARRGFIVVVAEYRRGILLDINQAIPNVFYTGAPQVSAFYRAAQDYDGCIRSFYTRQNANADEFKADLDNIFVSGFSAGAQTALLTAYYTQGMIDDISQNIKTALGNRKIDYYTGDMNIEYRSKIRGVLSGWGTAFLPRENVSDPTVFFARNTNNPPLISFHGYNDPINPIRTEPVYFSPATIGMNADPYHTITNCLLPGVSSFSVIPRPNTGTPLVDEYRGGPIYWEENIFNKIGLPPMESYIDCDMFHGLDDDGPNFDSEFGTHATDQDHVFGYIAQRTACFCQLILAGLANNTSKRVFC